MAGSSDEEWVQVQSEKDRIGEGSTTLPCTSPLQESSAIAQMSGDSTTVQEAYQSTFGISLDPVSAAGQTASVAIVDDVESGTCEVTVNGHTLMQPEGNLASDTDTERAVIKEESVQVQDDTSMESAHTEHLQEQGDHGRESKTVSCHVAQVAPDDSTEQAQIRSTSCLDMKDIAVELGEQSRPVQSSSTDDWDFSDSDDAQEDSDELKDSDPFKNMCKLMGRISDFQVLGQVQCEDLDPKHFVADENLINLVGALLMDRLARRQTWNKVLGNISSKSKVVASPKALLTFLSSSLPPAARMRQALWAQTIYPLPFVLKHPEHEGCLCLDPFHLVHILHGKFMVSIPFGVKGSSSMLNRLFRRNFEESPNEPGALHAGSVDLSMAKAGQEDFHILDFHSGTHLDGGMKCQEVEENKAVVLDLLQFAQYFLLQLPLDKSTIVKELVPYLNRLRGDASFQAYKKRVLVLFRDVDPNDKKLPKKKAAVDSELSQHLGIKSIEDCPWLDVHFLPTLSSMGTIQLDQVLNPVYSKIASNFQGAKGYADFWELKGVLSDVATRKLIFDDAMQDEAVKLNLYCSVKDAIHGVSNWPDALQWSRTPYQQSVQSEALSLKDVYEQRRNMTLSPVVNDFVCSLKDDVMNLNEWKFQLSGIAERSRGKRDSLRAKHSKVCDDLEQLNRELVQVSKSTGAIPSDMMTKKEDLQKEAGKLNSDMNDLTITSEKVWREALELHDCFGILSDSAKQRTKFCPSQLHTIFAECMKQGFAMELLDGDNLIIHPEFMEKVFDKLASEGVSEGLRTVSILGPQSSGKSTLANALWGGDFATSAGRCTKGLYASLFRTTFPGLPMLLFLDTEGLCSVEKDREFDQKLALLTIAMSDVILVNVRGDIDSRVANVLQMAVYCLKEMNILADQRKPEIIFIQRDMVDFSLEKQATTMDAVESQMREATKLLFNPDGSQVMLNEILHFDRSSLVLMPSAFTSQVSTMDGHVEVMVPNPGFGEECFKLRRLIADKASARPSNVKGFQAWGSRLCTIKMTIDKFGKLAHFHDVQAVLTRKRFDEHCNMLLDMYVYGCKGREAKNIEGFEEASQDGQTAVMSLDDIFTQEEEEIQNNITEMLKVGTCTDHERLLDDSKVSFERFAEAAKQRCIGEQGSLWRAFMDYCKAVTDISKNMQDEGLRNLENRVNMYVESRICTFVMSHRRHKANNCVDNTILALKGELTKIERSPEKLTKDAATNLFESKWESCSDKLKRDLEANVPDYDVLAQKAFEAFHQTRQVSALNIGIVMANSPMAQLSFMIFPEKKPQAGETPCLYSPHQEYNVANLARQFDLCVELHLPTRAATTPFEFYRGTWFLEHGQKFKITKRKVSQEIRMHIQGDWELKGTLSVGDRFSLYGSLSEAKGKMRVDVSLTPVWMTALQPGTMRKHENSLMISFSSGGDNTAPGQKATRYHENEEALKNMCDFFEVDFGEVQSSRWPNISDFLDNLPSMPWSTTSKPAHTDETAHKVKCELLHKLYLKVIDVVQEHVLQVDESFENLNVVANKLFNRLGKLPQDKPGFEPRWELRANMKNECLRVCRSWLVQEMWKKREEATGCFLQKFNKEKDTFLEHFLRRVTEIHNDKSNAIALLHELWDTKVRMSRRLFSNKVIEKISSLWRTPESFMKYCDEYYIGCQEQRTDEEIFSYLIRPADTMSSLVDKKWRERLDKETQEQRNVWHDSLKEFRQELLFALHDLRDTLKNADKMGIERVGDTSAVQRLASPSLAPEDETMYRVFYQYLTTGKASLDCPGGAPLELSTKHKVELDIYSVDQISDLSTFTNLLIRELDLNFNEKFLEEHNFDWTELDADRNKVKDLWIGCPFCCPYCRKKCTNQKHDISPTSLTKHECSLHQPLGFGGVKVEASSKPVFQLCDALEHNQRIYIDSAGNARDFRDHLAAEHPDWTIKLNPSNNPYYVEQKVHYEQIWDRPGVRQKLCAYHKMTPIEYKEGEELAIMQSSAHVQVAFLLDTTSSMGNELEQCKADTVNFALGLQQKIGRQFGKKGKLEVAFVGYKDKLSTGGVDPGHLAAHDFSENVESVQKTIQSQKATGGGDLPEDIAGAFRVAAGFAWNRSVTVKKVIVLIADAPCHGQMYHDPSMRDDFENDGAEMPVRLKALTDLQVSLLISAITDSTVIMQQQFEEHYKRHAGKGVLCSGFSLRRKSGELDSGDSLLNQVLESVSALVESSAE